MKKILKRLCTGVLALATVVTTLPSTTVHAESKQYWTQSNERVGIVEKVMNDGSIGSTFNEGHLTVEGEDAYCIDINTDFKNGYKTRTDASSRMTADQISDVALSIEYVKQYTDSHSGISKNHAWFTFPIDEEDVTEKIGLNEQYEEYAVHDTDNFPIDIGEYVSIEELNEMYEMIEELPDYIVECLNEFISHYGTLEEVVEHKDDIYYYPDCETMTDVAYYYIDELQALGDIPPSLQNYIDYEAYGRDLDMGGCFIETSRGMCEIPY